MEQIKLPNGPTIEFYTVKEKKPTNNAHVVFFIKAYNGMGSFAVGYYRTFKTAQGRFVSEHDGSHLESTVICWADKYTKI